MSAPDPGDPPLRPGAVVDVLLAGAYRRWHVVSVSDVGAGLLGSGVLVRIRVEPGDEVVLPEGGEVVEPALFLTRPTTQHLARALDELLRGYGIKPRRR